MTTYTTQSDDVHTPEAPCQVTNVRHSGGGGLLCHRNRHVTTGNTVLTPLFVWGYKMKQTGIQDFGMGGGGVMRGERAEGEYWVGKRV